MRRTIREKEPARPSTRLSTMLGADLTTIAKHRQAEPPKLIHLVRGDLDWIVMKALEKDRTRRYETANGLAMDIQRHLNNEPVVARPPSRLYEFQKTVRRHKFGFAAACGGHHGARGRGDCEHFGSHPRPARGTRAIATATGSGGRPRQRSQVPKAGGSPADNRPGRNAVRQWQI